MKKSMMKSITKTTLMSIMKRKSTNTNMRKKKMKMKITSQKNAMRMRETTADTDLRVL